MKKILFICILMFPTFDAFAEYANWRACFNKIKNDEVLGNRFFGRDRDKNEDYVVRDNNGNIIEVGMEDSAIKQQQERTRIVKALFEYMAEKCDASFADIAREAYTEKADKEQSIVFNYKYTNQDIGNGLLVPEHASIHIYPKKDFYMYPRLYGYWVSNATKVYNKGDIINAKSDVFWKDTCSKHSAVDGRHDSVFNNASREIFGSNRAPEHYSTYYLNSNGLLFGRHSKWAGGQTGMMYGHEFVETFGETEGAKALETFENFYDKIRQLDESANACYEEGNTMRIYTVLFSKQKALNTTLCSTPSTFTSAKCSSFEGRIPGNGSDISNFVIVSEKPHRI